jgi:hypothetical protein
MVRDEHPSREATAWQGSMIFAIKAEVSDPRAETFAFDAQKTMYGGKHIAKGDTIFVFASENEGGPGLIASGVVISAKAIPKKRGIPLETPRVSISIRRTTLAKRRLGAASSNFFPTGKTADLRPSSISNSIARQRTRLSASRMKRRRSSANSFNDGNKNDRGARHDCLQRSRRAG